MANLQEKYQKLKFPFPVKDVISSEYGNNMRTSLFNDLFLLLFTMKSKLTSLSTVIKSQDKWSISVLVCICMSDESQSNLRWTYLVRSKSQLTLPTAPAIATSKEAIK